MNFISKEHLNTYLSGLEYIGMGSVGACYLNRKDNTILKIFHGFDEDDFSFAGSEKGILRFSNVKNNTFIWPKDTITIRDSIVGYSTPYVKAKNLENIDPLKVKLDKLCSSIKSVRKDIKTVSNEGISLFDVLYNTMYGRKFYIIDSDEYDYRDMDPGALEEKNNRIFDAGIYYFLIDSYFNGIVNSNKELRSLYHSKDEDVLEFIKLFRNYLSELSGKEITCLGEAKDYSDKKPIENKYIRLLK